MAESNHTVAQVVDLVSYNRETGVFTWTRSRRGPVRAGEAAGYTDPKGYVVIHLFGRNIRAHRLAWFVCHGKWPSLDLDHINGKRSDNRIANLREVGNAINRENMRSPRADNRSGFLGVSPAPKGSTGYRATIQLRGRQRHLGIFPTPEAAYAAYVSAKRELHEGCTI